MPAVNGKAKEHPVVWWVGWIALTILSFFVSCYFWTGFIAQKVGPIDQKGVSILWVTAVFGSWMVLLVPLIVVMYNKVDRAYDEARSKRESQNQKKLSAELGLRSTAVPAEKRLLPRDIQKILKKMPRTLREGHLVTLQFRDGVKVENAFVLGSQEIVGLYGRDSFPFDAKDVVGVELLDPAKTQPVEYEKWLRFDD